MKIELYANEIIKQPVNTIRKKEKVKQIDNSNIPATTQPVPVSNSNTNIKVADTKSSQAKDIPIPKKQNNTAPSDAQKSKQKNGKDTDCTLI